MEVFRLILKQQTGAHLDTEHEVSLAVAAAVGDLLVEPATVGTAQLPPAFEAIRVVERVFTRGGVALIVERVEELPADLVTALGHSRDTLGRSSSF